MLKFVGQCVHVLLIDVRRVTHDEFVASTLEPGEKIGLYRVHATFEAVARLHSGEVDQLHGDLHLVWKDHTQDGDEEATWLVHEWHTASLELVTSPRPLFVERLDEAVPDPAVRERARRSLHRSETT